MTYSWIERATKAWVGLMLISVMLLSTVLAVGAVGLFLSIAWRLIAGAFA